VEGLNVGVVDAKPGDHGEVERIENGGHRGVTVEDAVLGFAVEHHELHGEIASATGASPDRALAIDERRHGARRLTLGGAAQDARRLYRKARIDAKLRNFYFNM
jgi:hypothetical protein